MYVSRVVYSRLVNTGSYENERFECEVSLTESDDTDKAFALAITRVTDQVSALMKRISTPDRDEDGIPY